MATTKLISILCQNRLLRTQAEISAFESALSALTRSFNPADLPDLFLVFTDACAQQEVLWGLLHFVESFGMERQLQAMIQVLPSMIADASEWAKLFHCRVLNDSQYRTYYRNLISSHQGIQRQTVERILDEIKAEDADFASLVDYVLSR